MAEKAKTSIASKFLLLLLALILLSVAAVIWAAANPLAVMRGAFVPDHPISEEPATPAPNYSDASGWFIRPGQPSPTSDYLPEDVSQIAMVPEADVFYLHPTTYFKRARWNAPLDNEDANDGVNGLVIKHQATAFTLSAQVYLPRYRQATFGAFLAEDGAGWLAIDFAYQDVLAAFDHYIENDNKGRPFILAAHSQGSLLGLRLLRDRISGTELADQMVGAYLIGWPISIEEDLGALPDIEPCMTPDQNSCVSSFLSFAPDGDSSNFVEVFHASDGFSGNSKIGSSILCTNPLTWTVGGAAGTALHLGGLEFSKEVEPLGAPKIGLTGAECDSDGFLRLTKPPVTDIWRELEAGPGSYHVYDYNLFYMNIRENAAVRTRAWIKKQ